LVCLFLRTIHVLHTGPLFAITLFTHTFSRYTHIISFTSFTAHLHLRTFGAIRTHFHLFTGFICLPVGFHCIPLHLRQVAVLPHLTVLFHFLVLSPSSSFLRYALIHTFTGLCVPPANRLRCWTHFLLGYATRLPFTPRGLLHTLHTLFGLRIHFHAPFTCVRGFAHHLPGSRTDAVTTSPSHACRLTYFAISPLHDLFTALLGRTTGCLFSAHTPLYYCFCTLPALPRFAVTPHAWTVCGPHTLHRTLHTHRYIPYIFHCYTRTRGAAQRRTRTPFFLAFRTWFSMCLRCTSTACTPPCLWRAPPPARTGLPGLPVPYAPRVPSTKAHTTHWFAAWFLPPPHSRTAGFTTGSDWDTLHFLMPLPHTAHATARLHWLPLTILLSGLLTRRAGSHLISLHAPLRTWILRFGSPVYPFLPYTLVTACTFSSCVRTTIPFRTPTRSTGLHRPYWFTFSLSCAWTRFTPPHCVAGFTLLPPLHFTTPHTFPLHLSRVLRRLFTPSTDRTHWFHTTPPVWFDYALPRLRARTFPHALHTAGFPRTPTRGSRTTRTTFHTTVATAPPHGCYVTLHVSRTRCTIRTGFTTDSCIHFPHFPTGCGSIFCRIHAPFGCDLLRYAPIFFCRLRCHSARVLFVYHAYAHRTKRSYALAHGYIYCALARTARAPARLAHVCTAGRVPLQPAGSFRGHFSACALRHTLSLFSASLALHAIMPAHACISGISRHITRSWFAAAHVLASWFAVHSLRFALLPAHCAARSRPFRTFFAHA